LTAIHLPTSLETIGENCFARCRSLARITLEHKPRLSRLETVVLAESRLAVIHLPASLEVIDGDCFSQWRSPVL
jgi:hypothetical protein